MSTRAYAAAPASQASMSTMSGNINLGPTATPASVGMSYGERLLVAATPIVTLGALVGLGYPPYAALTRYRVAHIPSQTQSPAAGDQVRTDRPTYWQVLKAVKAKEGARGLYKGLLLNLSVGVAPWSTVLVGYGILRVFPRAAPYLLTGGLAQLGWQAVTTLAVLPFEILAVRALATPHSIPVTSPVANLRLLLTADERSHPFRSLYTPSRFLASFIPTILAPISGVFLLPKCLDWFGERNGLIAFLLSQLLLAVGVRTPLAVLAARLNAQRHGGTGAAIVHQKGEEAAAVEGVVQIRPTPYRNILDCAQTMIREEGWCSLWRGWPLELLLALRNYA